MRLNPPVKTKTLGVYDAYVTDITNRETDQLDGYVVLEKGKRNVCWDFDDNCRNNSPELNLNMRLPEHAILRQPLPRKSRK